MGSNLTEKSLKRAARNVSTLYAIAEKFDNLSVVPYRTSAHKTRSDTFDVQKVMHIVSQSKLLLLTSGRTHTCFQNIHFNPLHKWDRNMAEAWVEQKKNAIRNTEESYVVKEMKVTQMQLIN